MAESRTYNPTTAESLLVGWIERVVDPTVQVMIANQGNNRPTLPFVTVEVLTDRELEEANQCTGAETSPGFYEVMTSEIRQGTATVRAYGRDAYAIMRAIDRSRHREDVAQDNSDAGIEIMDALTPITLLSQPMGTTTEQSRAQDYAFSYAELTTEDDSVQVVERVIGTGDILPDNLPVDVTAP